MSLTDVLDGCPPRGKNALNHRIVVGRGRHRRGRLEVTERVVPRFAFSACRFFSFFRFLVFVFRVFYRRGSLSTTRTGRWMRRRTACGSCTISYSSPGRRQGERRRRTSCAVAVLASFADSQSKAIVFFAKRIRKTRRICKTDVAKRIRETGYHS